MQNNTYQRPVTRGNYPTHTGFSRSTTSQVALSVQQEAPKNTKLPKFAVLNVKPIGIGNLRGFFSLRIGPLTLHKWRLVQQPGQEPFISPAQETWEVDGQRKYTTLAEFPKAWRKPILEAVLSSWDNQVEIGGNVR